MSNGNDLQLSVIVKMIDETTTASKAVVDSIKAIDTAASTVAKTVNRDMVGSMGGFKEVTDLTRKHFKSIIEQTGKAKSVHAGAIEAMSSAGKTASDVIDRQAKLAAFKAKQGIVDITAQAKESGDELIQNAERVGAGIGKAMLVVGGVFTAKGVFDFVKAGIDAADSINDLSQKIGVSVENLAGYKLAAEQSGTSLEGMGNAAKKLNQEIATNNPLLAKLGITAKDANGAMSQLANVFASIPDGAQKTAIAMRLMGKSGADMIPLLNGGGAALEKMLEQGRKLYPVTTEMARAADQFNDSMVAFNVQAEGFGISIANHILPGMNGMLARWNDAISLSQKHGGFIGLVMGGINPTGTNSANLKEINSQIENMRQQLGYVPKGADTSKFDAELARLQAIKKSLQEIQRAQALALNDKFGTADYKVAKTPRKELPKDLLDKSSKAAKATKDKIDLIDPFGKERNAAIKAAADANNKAFDEYAAGVDYKIAQDEKLAASFGALNIDVAEGLRESIGQLFGSDASRAFDAVDKDISKMRASLASMQDGIDPAYYAQMVEAINALADSRYKLADAELINSEFSKAQQTISSAEASLQSRVVTGLLDETQARIDLRQIIGQQGNALQDLIPKLQALMAASNDASKTAGLQAMIDKIKEMQAIGAQSGWLAGMESGLNKYAKASTDVFKTVEDAVSKSFKSMEDSLTNFVMTGKLDFKSLANSMIADMVRIAIQQSVTKPLAAAAASFLPSIFGVKSAQGNVFNSAGLSAYSNQIVSQPTVFPFAHGIGLMGEAGPEAIMPLKRGPDGNLGVRASGGSSNVTVNVINNAQGTKATARESTDGSGNRMIEVFIEQVKGAIAGDISRGSGSVPDAMASTYGLNRVAGAY
jgi:lambda family phage tail tape measure protein